MKRYQLSHSAFCSMLLLVSSTAIADVTISGTMDASVEKFITHSNPGNYSGNATINRLGSTLANYNSLSLKGVENLSSNLKATYEISMKYIGASSAVSPANYLSHVGLEGEFGKIKLGQQWRPMFTAVAVIDPTELAATPGFAGAGKNGTGLAGLGPEPNSNTLTYNIPNVVPGLFVQLQKGYAGAASGAGDSYGAHVILTNGETFYIAYAMNAQKMLVPTLTAPSVFAASATGTNGLDTMQAYQTLIGTTGLNHLLYSSTTGGESRNSSGFAGSYNFGVLKLVAGHVSETVAGTTAKLSLDLAGIKVPLTPEINLGYVASHSSNTQVAALGGKTFGISGNKLLLTYNMSKRTTAYFAKGYQKLDGGTAAGNEFSTGIAALGMKHNF